MTDTFENERKKEGTTKNENKKKKLPTCKDKGRKKKQETVHFHVCPMYRKSNQKQLGRTGLPKGLHISAALFYCFETLFDFAKMYQITRQRVDTLSSDRIFENCDEKCGGNQPKPSK